MEIKNSKIKVKNSKQRYSLSAIFLILCFFAYVQSAQAEPPVAYNGSVVLAEDANTVIELSASDSQARELTYHVVEQAFYGETFTRRDAFDVASYDEHNNRFFYDSIGNFHGQDYLNFVVRAWFVDDKGVRKYEESNMARVNITVTPVDDKPAMYLKNLAFVVLPSEGQVTKTFPIKVVHNDEEEPLTFSVDPLTPLPPGAQLDPVSGVLTWVMNSSMTKDYGPVKFIVSDGISQDSDTVILRIRDKALTYYVDTNNPLAKDTNSGTQEAPFKTIQQGVNVLLPGDTLYVRAGRYQEAIKVSYKFAGDYITIKAYPGEQPLVDGSFDLNGWQKCTAGTCDTPYWENMWYADVPAATTVFSANLYMGEEMMRAAQDPNPATALDYQIPTPWRVIPSDGYTNTQIIDPAVFTQEDPHAWDNAYVMVHSGNNNIFTRAIKEYIPSEHRVTFDNTCDMQWIEPGVDKYALWGHMRLVDGVGEYHLDGISHKVYLYYDKDNAPANVTISSLEYGFSVRNQSYVIIDGFKFRRQTAPPLGWHSGVAIQSCTGDASDHIIFRNNEVTQNGILAGRAVYMSGCDDCLVDNNYIHDTPSGGIAVSGVSSKTLKNTVVSNNHLERVWGTGIHFYWADKCSMINNTDLNGNGQHANGLTAYLWSRNIDIIGNTVINCNNALTLNVVSNITIKDNVFVDGPDYGSPTLLISWDGLVRGMVVDHNTILDSKGHAGLVVPSYGKDVIITNNISDGISQPSASLAKFSNFTLENNLYTGIGSGTSIEQTGKLEKDVYSIFADYDNFDYRLKPDSVACYMSDAGSFVGAKPPIGCDSDVPIAMFKASAMETYEHESVDFNASDSMSCSSGIKSYDWSFGDGGIASGAQVSYVFNKAGVYKVQLTVTNQEGKSDSSEKTIVVSPASVPGLHLYLNCNDNLTDLSGKNNNAQWVDGNGAYAQGVNGQALSMNGTVDSPYAIVDNSSTLDGFSNGITFSVWAKKGSVSGNGNLLSKHVAYYLYIGSNGFSGYIFNSTGTRLNFSATISSTSVTDWHNYAVSYNGSQVQLYFDGQPIGSAYSFSGPLAVSTHDLYIGRDPWGSSFSGNIDDIYIFSRGLDASQIKDLYDKSLGNGAAVLYGDISGDSALSAYDAALAARIAVGLDAYPTGDNLTKADVSGDKQVTAYDAALIAQRVVGLIDRFPVEE
jgi:parallel beta-helix repeat protein